MGVEQGLKKDSSIHCDELVSLPKATLTHYVGSLKHSQMEALDIALRLALGLD